MRGMSTRLPPLIQRYLERAVPGGPPYPRHVRTRQEGEMCLKPGGRWKRFTADQDFDADKTFFEWRSRLPLVGPLAIDVVDRVEDGHGELRAKVFGIAVMAAEGPDTDVGELMRYLAELPWNPGAIALNEALEWKQIDDHTVEVRCIEGDAEATVLLLFGDDGDIHRTCAVRPRNAEEPAVPWGGDFGDYRDVGGLRIPTTAEVWWDLPQGRHEYFRGRVTSLTREN